ncbi:MAG: hypothetical protein WBD99_00665 [Thermodesulfobacteriota bacterium]
MRLTMKERRSVTAVVAKRYQKATKKEKVGPTTIGRTFLSRTLIG